ncbi:MAG: hypothetical protein HY565_05300 [Candidatus Kerfeldbacteria bacterium]|nr:hypothetical protein [Candidatus Kerfeldbacteria bacterium]
MRLWILLLMVMTAWSYWYAPTAPFAQWWQAAVYVLAPASAVLGGVVAVKQYGIHSAQGRILCALTIGITGWFVGEVLWTYYELIAHIDPYPSLADLFYFSSYGAFAIGLVWELKFLRTQVQRARPHVEWPVLALAAVTLSGLAIYFGVFQAIKPDYSWLENAVAISYGVADIGLVLMGLVITVVTAEMRGGKLAQPWWWFLAGISCIFVADIGFAVFTFEYEQQQWLYKASLDSLWIAGYLAMAYGLGRFAVLVYSAQRNIRPVSRQ